MHNKERKQVFLFCMSHDIIILTFPWNVTRLFNNEVHSSYSHQLQVPSISLLSKMPSMGISGTYSVNNRYSCFSARKYGKTLLLSSWRAQLTHTDPWLCNLFHISDKCNILWWWYRALQYHYLSSAVRHSARHNLTLCHFRWIYL